MFDLNRSNIPSRRFDWRSGGFRGSRSRLTGCHEPGLHFIDTVVPKGIGDRTQGEVEGVFLVVKDRFSLTPAPAIYIPAKAIALHSSPNNFPPEVCQCGVW